MQKAYRRTVILSIIVLSIIVPIPLLAQAPDLNHMHVRAPIRISDATPDPGTPKGILPVQFKAAYGFNRIPNQGKGQTIAIIDAYIDPFLQSDVASYLSYFHLQSCNFHVVTVGHPLNGQGWDLEESLDAEQVCALAPQANVLLFAANSDSLADMLTGVQVATSAPYNATVVSMSWGYHEFQGEQALDSYFCNIFNTNGAVTFVAASGDLGHQQVPYYPSASPCVIAVGGTTLTLSTAVPLANPLALDYGNETTWNDSTGGISPYESGPPWQDGIFPGCGSTGMRCIPDVSSHSNPNPGVPVYDSYGYGGWVQVGGTSIASPDWAAFFTLVNAMRAAANPPKDTLSQAVQDLYAIYESSSYLTDFHDITQGDNNGNCGAACLPGPGYDLVTGIGSYQANVLAPALVAAPN
ncbi:MAG: S8 family serine peptidase [Candidatus Korobacteraceae bacterium]